MTRGRGTILAATALMIGMAPVAWAEGSWTSYIHGAMTGFDSRTWTDGATDGDATKIRFDDCLDINHPFETPSTEVQLTRQTPWWWPDEDRGRKMLHCLITDTGNWGWQPVGGYHFTITKINGRTSGGRIDVDYVEVEY